jgi:hypothetical protein
MAIIEARQDGGLDQDSSIENGNKWLDRTEFKVVRKENQGSLFSFVCLG